MTQPNWQSRVLAVALVALTAGPASAQSALDEAWAALWNEQPAAAVERATAALASGGLSVDDAAAAYNLRGIAFMRQEDFVAAAADLDVAVALVPNFASARVNRGLVRAKQEDYRGAISDFDRALELVPNETEVLFMRGNAHFDSEAFQNAIVDYSAALEKAPDHWMLRLNRCEALRQVGRIKEARSDCARARALSPAPDIAARVEKALGGPCDCKP